MQRKYLKKTSPQVRGGKMFRRWDGGFSGLDACGFSWDRTKVFLRMFTALFKDIVLLR